MVLRWLGADLADDDQAGDDQAGDDQAENFLYMYVLCNFIFQQFQDALEFSSQHFKNMVIGQDLIIVKLLRQCENLKTKFKLRPWQASKSGLIFIIFNTNLLWSIWCVISSAGHSIVIKEYNPHIMQFIKARSIRSLFQATFGQLSLVILV